MEYMYLCPKCKEVYSQENDEPIKNLKCPECDNSLLYTGFTSGKWNTKTQSEREKIKYDLISDVEGSFNVQVQSAVQDIRSSIRTIKNILVFFTVLWVIGMVILLIKFV